MPRFLIISIVALLILGLIGGATVFVIQRLRGEEMLQVQEEPSGTLQLAEPGSPQIVESVDDDKDGLPNAEEGRWGSDPTKQDTDGDGYLDGEEIAAGHNPVVPAPNDLLPRQTPAAPAPVTAGGIPNVDQYFAEGLDLTLGNKNFTEEYRRLYRENERTNDTLITYARQQSIITQLPSIQDKPIQKTPDNSPTALRTYLNTVGDLTAFYPRQLLTEALANLYQNSDPSGIQSLIVIVRLYQQNLLATPVPPAAESLHKILLGYTELLLATYGQMARYGEDPVRSVVAMRQLEEIDRRYFSLIATEAERLSALLQ
jgi:hypothetical protein